MTDGPVGVRSINGEATVFPASIALAASWDKELVEKVGAAIGQETKAKGKYDLLAPRSEFVNCDFSGKAEIIVFYGSDSPKGWETKFINVDLSNLVEAFTRFIYTEPLLRSYSTETDSKMEIKIHFVIEKHERDY